MKTNLENAGSIYGALETYLKHEGTDAFIAWCKAPCKQILPEWLKVGEWFTSLDTDECYKIADITDGFVYTTCGGDFPVKYIAAPEMNYRPITIKPWSLGGATKVMRANTPLWVNDQTITLVEVLVGCDDDLIIVHCDNGACYSTGYLADYGETLDHQPCGTPILVNKKETSND